MSRKVPTNLLGRTYDEFSAFLEANPDISVVEMDTVHGNRGGKSILTFLSGKQRTKLFYCNPMASYQKPHIEKNHEYIRYL